MNVSLLSIISALKTKFVKLEFMDLLLLLLYIYYVCVCVCVGVSVSVMRKKETW